MKNEKVVLVNLKGKRTGLAEKLEAHREGLLHRAFSVFIFNRQGEMLLQRRAAKKYHFGGLWSNACCSHPRPTERVLSAAKRRLNEELSFQTSLEPMGAVTYKFHDPKSGLTEHEYDYIFTGNFDSPIYFNKEEVQAIRWISIPDLKRELKNIPESFTPWFLKIMAELKMG